MLKKAIPDAQEQKRFRSINAETSALHFSQLETLIEIYKLDECRIWNCDETGKSPERDSRGKLRQPRFLRRHSNKDAKPQLFLYGERVTVLPAVSASWEVAPLLFIFHGKQVPYQDVLINGEAQSDSIVSHLPRHFMVYMKEESSGIDSESFFQFAKSFTNHVKDLTASGRHVLLTYDACRSHMTLGALEHLKQNNVVVYALPAHSSGKTEPLGTGVFGTFKRELNSAIDETVTDGNSAKIDLFELSSIIHHAYLRSFTPKTITDAFRKSEMWPLDRTVLMSSPRPLDLDKQGDIISIERMEDLFQEKRKLARDLIVGQRGVVKRRGVEGVFWFIKRGKTSYFVTRVQKTS